MDMYAEVMKDLHTEWAGRHLLCFEKLKSTNLTAKEEGEAGAVHGTLITADMQTAGRGRSGRSWQSPKGCNLYFSLLLRPEFQPKQASMLTLVMAHSVARAIQQEIDSRVDNGRKINNQIEDYRRSEEGPVQIKWPNDILIHGKKVCGILTELSVDRDGIRYVVIGVGINVTSQKFSGELADKASSLEEECGKEIFREKLLAQIMNCFEEDYEFFVREGNLAPFVEAYHSRLVNKDTAVKVLDPKEPFEGIARGITDNGELIVEKCDGTRVQVYAGEVSVRGMQGYI